MCIKFAILLAGEPYCQHKKAVKHTFNGLGADIRTGFYYGALISSLFVRNFFTSSGYPWLLMILLNWPR